MTMKLHCQVPPRRQNSREKGIALLMTLAVLSLLLVLAFSFALAAINSQAVGKLDGSLMRARLEAENSLQKVYEELAIDFAVSSDVSNLFPATAPLKGARLGPPGSPCEGRYYWCSHSPAGQEQDQDQIDPALHVKLGEVDYLPFGFKEFDPSVGWVHILAGETKDRIVARYAYVIIDESGKIDPSSAVSASHAEGSEPPREGLSSSEIDLNNLFADAAVASYFQPLIHEGGALPENLRWLSHYHIFHQDSTLTSAANDEDIRIDVLANLFPHSYDIEAYHDSPIDRHRFNLDADWDAIAIATIDTSASVYWEEPSGTGRGMLTPAPNTGGIPWLHYANTQTKYQIIANLIDYCDSDSLPTTDYTEDPAPFATYVGLEQLPYINEFAFTLSLAEVAETPGSYELNTDFRAELINMHDIDINIDQTSLLVSVTLGYSIDNVPDEATFTYILNASEASYGDMTIDAQSYYGYSNLAARATLPLGSSSSQVFIADLRIKYAVLKDSAGQVLDFVGASEPLAETGATKNISLTDNFKTISYEVDDPRANHHRSGWRWQLAWGDGPGEGNTIGSRNTFCNPAPQVDVNLDGFLEKDHEPEVSDPWGVSTNYIRNAPMESMWELGTIHRGAPWETINLKRHNTHATSTTGLGSYVNGDANILDQVKMGDRLREVGRVNINTYNKSVLRALLAGVPIASHYDSALRTDILLPVSAAEDLAEEIVRMNGAVRADEAGNQIASIPFSRRSAFANVPNIGRDWENLDAYLAGDAAMESIVGRVAPLATIRQNYFTIILVAQVVDDVGGTEEEMLIRVPARRGSPAGDVPAMLKRFDPGADRILAQQRVMAVVYRDALNATHYRLVRYEYIE